MTSEYVIYFVNITLVLFKYFVVLRLLYDLCNYAQEWLFQGFLKETDFSAGTHFLPMAFSADSQKNRLLSCMACSNLRLLSVHCSLICLSKKCLTLLTCNLVKIGIRQDSSLLDNYYLSIISI